MTTSGISAIVLAGGRSSRFGRDKLAELIDGRSLLELAIDAVRPVAAEIIVVAAPGRRRRLPAGVVLAHDPAAFEGPLAGLLSGLRRAGRPAVLVVAGDMPSMLQDVLRALVAGLGDPAVDAVIFGHEGRGRPLPGAMRTGSALLAAERLVGDGERRLRALYDRLATSVIDEATWRALDPDGRTLRDVDTPGDLP